jgi:hypothetical protein
MDVFLPAISKQLHVSPLANHARTEYRPTTRMPNRIPPEGQSFMGPVDVRQPACPETLEYPVPDRFVSQTDNATHNRLISPGVQRIVFQNQTFDLFPIHALDAIMQDRGDRENFNNLERSPQKLAALPDWSMLPRISAITEPMHKTVVYGHIQVANELPQHEMRGKRRIDTGVPRPFATPMKTFEEFDGLNTSGGGGVSVDLSPRDDPCVEP